MRKPFAILFFYPADLGAVPPLVVRQGDDQFIVEIRGNLGGGYWVDWPDPTTPDGDSPLFETLADAVDHVHRNAVAFALSWQEVKDLGE